MQGRLNHYQEAQRQPDVDLGEGEYRKAHQHPQGVIAIGAGDAVKTDAVTVDEVACGLKIVISIVGRKKAEERRLTAQGNGSTEEEDKDHQPPLYIFKQRSTFHGNNLHSPVSKRYAQSSIIHKNWCLSGLFPEVLAHNMWFCCRAAVLVRVVQFYYDWCLMNSMADQSHHSHRTVHFSHAVPYYCQIADQVHAADYLDHGKSLLADPFWYETGAATPQEYAYWAVRSCGMVCVKMCVEALGGPCLPLQAWIERGLAVDAYLTEKRPGQATIEKGWLHAGLAQVMAQEGLCTGLKPVDVNGLYDDISSGKLVIASVSHELGSGKPITHQGEHLVVVTGMLCEAGRLSAVVVHNPSGRNAALQEYAVIPIERFIQAFSGRVITVKKDSDRPERTALQ